MLALSGGLKDTGVLNPGDGKMDLALTDCLNGCRLVCACHSKVLDVDWPGAVVLARPGCAKKSHTMHPAVLSSRFCHEKNLGASATRCSRLATAPLAPE